MSYLRPYQNECRDSSIAELSNGSRSTLFVMPTGTGKTEVALDIIDNWPDKDCGILCLAHREELVWQPWERWRKKTDEYADMEMGEYRRSGQSRLTFASKDSLHVNRLRSSYRDPKAVGLIWVDEAHHLCKKNKSYQHILDYFLDANPDCRVLGSTATPDRTDEEALGQVFDSVAFDFPLLDPTGGPSAIGDGWLVPIEQEYIVVEELHFERVGSRGGDFIESQLERMILEDKGLYKIASATAELAGEQTTLCFQPGIASAIAEATIFNAQRDGSAYAIASRITEEQRADFVIDSGDKDRRRRILKKWGRGEFQFFCNVGVFTEGMDEPRIGCISMGRPTKSRSLYAQMAGRGTRILPNTIEGRREDGSYWRLDSVEERKAAIAASGKPSVLIMDFVGNSRHSLISAADILGGHYPDDVVEAAKEKVASGKRDVREALEEAEEAIRVEMERRRQVRARAGSMQRTRIDPFGAIGVVATREPGWHKGRLPSAKMKNALARFKVEQHEIDKMSFHQAREMLGRLIARANDGRCTYKQAKTLAKFGLPTDVSFDQASNLMNRLAANGWKPLSDNIPEAVPF